MDYREIDSRDRRVVILASLERSQELSQVVDWKKVAAGDFPLASSIVIPGLFLGPFVQLGITGYILYRVLKGKGKRKLPYPLFELRTARDQFNFPINHPIDGLAYASCEAEPNLYVPLASFHQYMYEAKLAAFHELCANLGVRRCTVVYAEEDGQDITMRVRISGIPTQIGPVSGSVSASSSHHSIESAAVFAEYPLPDRPLTETQYGWMNGEPTWVTMQKLRFERNLERWQAEFSYSNDMGINAAAAAKIAGVGIDIGGKFEEMHRRKWIFDVEFWSRETTSKKRIQ